jgi:sn-glycerol 3-phosphate transport system substrate-binding protein
MLAFITALSMLLSSCAQQPDPTPVPPTEVPAAATEEPQPTEEPAPEPVTITFWYALGGSKGETFMAMVEDFMKEYPHITVEATYSGNYGDTAQKVLAAVASETLPNGGVIPAGPLWTGREGNFLIDEYIKGPDGLDMDDFWPVLWTYNEWDGKISSLPFNNSTLVLYYNKDLMQKAGLDPEKPPETWDELKSMAEQIVEKAQGEIPVWGVDTKSPDWTLKYLITQAGGSMMNEDSSEPTFASEAGYEAMTWWKSLVDEGLMPPAQHGSSRDLFIAGNLGFLYSSTGSVGTVASGAQFDWDTTFCPKQERYGGTVGGAALCLFPSDKAKEDATWTFLKWLLSPENVVRWTLATGYVPVRKSSLQDPDMQAFFEEAPQYRAGFEQLEYAEAYPHFWEMGGMDGYFKEALEKVELGVLEAKDAVDEASDKLKADMVKTGS